MRRSIVIQIYEDDESDGDDDDDDDGDGDDDGEGFDHGDNKSTKNIDKSIENLKHDTVFNSTTCTLPYLTTIYVTAAGHVIVCIISRAHCTIMSNLDTIMRVYHPTPL